MPPDLIVYILSPFVAAAVAVLLVVGMARWIDREHREALAYRRREMGHLYVTNMRTYPGRADGSPSELIVAEYVLGCNIWTTLVGRLKMLFGGEIGGFHDLATRARQEVVLRVMEQAAARGFDAVCNLRLESVDIAGQTTASGKQKNRKMFVGLIAHATAYRRVPNAYPPPAPPTLMGYLN
jgi:uncharacterized protein YbjQ (UPF0145 family)